MKLKRIIFFRQYFKRATNKMYSMKDSNCEQPEAKTTQNISKSNTKPITMVAIATTAGVGGIRVLNK